MTNPLTIEAGKQPDYNDPEYRKSVEQAYKDGKRVQVFYSDLWLTFGDSPILEETPKWYWKALKYRIHPEDLNKEKDWTTPEAQAEVRRMWSADPAMERERWDPFSKNWQKNISEDWIAGCIYRPAQPAPKQSPEVNWSAMPAWAEWVAMGAAGNWYYFETKPVMMGGFWGCRTSLFDIPPQFAPKYTGDWKDSLAQRGGAA